MAFWMSLDWAETVMERTPRKRFDVTEVPRVISKELNFSDLSLAKISWVALRTIFSSSIPKTVVLISRPMEKKVQCAPSMFRASVERSRFLTTLHPGKKTSLSTAKFAGKSMLSLMSIVSGVLLSDMRPSLGLENAGIN
jgi:hypothetical protein